MNKSSFWLAAFVAIAAAELIGEISGNAELILWTKPFLMPLLGAWFFFSTAGSTQFLRRAILSGLAFATAGDILLMFAHDAAGALFFLLGLGAFLMTHLFYTGGFFLTDKRKTQFLLKNPWWAIPFVAYTVALMSWLWPGIPKGLHGPVTAYSAAISLTALSIVNLYPLVSKQVFYRLLTGAALFIFSDSLIAVNRFGHPFEGARLAIMISYIAGQLLIVYGARMPAANIPDTGNTGKK